MHELFLTVVRALYSLDIILLSDMRFRNIFSLSWLWWSAIPALGRLRQEDCEIEARLGYLE
jgi:hypothetical protein